MRLGVAVFESVVAWSCARTGAWWLAIAIILVIELVWRRPERTRAELVPFAADGLVALGFVATIAVHPKAVTQIGLAVAYVLWRVASSQLGGARSGRRIMLAQLLLLESLLLAASEFAWPRVIVMMLVWAACFAPAWLWLSARGEGQPGLLAGVWALIAAEVSFAFLVWQVSYVGPGSYLIVPQAVVVLAGLGYVFGGVYLSQRAGELGRRRLVEYLLVLALLVVIVVAGSPWRIGV